MSANLNVLSAYGYKSFTNLIGYLCAPSKAWKLFHNTSNKVQGFKSFSEAFILVMKRNFFSLQRDLTFDYLVFITATSRITLFFENESTNIFFNQQRCHCSTRMEVFRKAQNVKLIKFCEDDPWIWRQRKIKSTSKLSAIPNGHLNLFSGAREGPINFKVHKNKNN